MKSLRLNRSLRKAILDNFESKWIQSNKAPDKGKCVREIRSELANKLWELVYGKYDTTGLPDNLLHHRASIRVQLPNGEVDCLYYSHNKIKYLLGSREVQVEYVIQEDNQYWIDCLKDIKESESRERGYQKWSDSKESFLNEVSSILDSVNTTGQFVEVWPEAQEFIPEGINNPSKINLPAISLDKLNNQL